MIDMLTDGIALFQRELEFSRKVEDNKRLETIRDSMYAQFDPRVGEEVECITTKPAPGWSADWAYPDVEQTCIEVGKRYVIEKVYPYRGIKLHGIDRELHVTYFRKTR